MSEEPVVKWDKIVTPPKAQIDPNTPKRLPSLPEGAINGTWMPREATANFRIVGGPYYFYDAEGNVIGASYQAEVIDEGPPKDPKEND
jgi:hypothetical protein